jgi:hypothetical protein
VDDFNMNEFIKMIFTAGIECLPDCNACTCEEEPANPADCFTEEKNDANIIDFRQQLDELYCWAPTTCPRPAYTTDERRKKFKDRHDRYTKISTAIESETHDERAKRVAAFINDPAPTKEKLESHLSMLDQSSVKPAQQRELTPAEIRKLKEAIVLHYMDSIALNEAKYRDYNTEIKKFKSALEHVRNNIPYHKAIYRKWKYEEVGRLNPDFNFLRYKTILA